MTMMPLMQVDDLQHVQLMLDISVQEEQLQLLTLVLLEELDFTLMLLKILEFLYVEMD